MQRARQELDNTVAAVFENKLRPDTCYWLTTDVEVAVTSHILAFWTLAAVQQPLIQERSSVAWHPS